MSALHITRAGPLVSVQDAGRPGMLIHGVAASGPMDRYGFQRAAAVTGIACGAGIEFGVAGLSFTYSGAPCIVGFAGGAFRIFHNGEPALWPRRLGLQDGDVIEIQPGPLGNYGYVRFDREIAVPEVLDSRSTNVTVGLGGLKGRALVAGDVLNLEPLRQGTAQIDPTHIEIAADAPIRVIWGMHADLFPAKVREAFCVTPFHISSQMDRMGIRLKNNGLFDGQRILSLVSDSVVPGDIQVLGDGTPIILMADHQPTGGYPRIATVIDADRDRLAQLRPGHAVIFQPVSVKTAQALRS